MGHVNQRKDWGRGLGTLYSLAKFIADTALEWFPRYIILSVLKIESSTVARACQRRDKEIET